MDLGASLYEYCLTHGEEALLRQWHPEKNAPLTPQTITYGSKRKIWWRCEQGHQWQAAPFTRAAGTGCPYCAGKRPVAGKNDLAALYPELAAQWDTEKNAPLTPEEVLPGSRRKAWWRCEKGHSWQAQIKSRVNGCGCPVCANRRIVAEENSLAALYPELAAQWHPTKNGDLTPAQVAVGTRRRVWWMCERGHEWRAAVSPRTGGVGCPVCAGKTVIPGENDLASAFPGIAGEWHPEKNGPLTAQKVSPYSNRKAWWKCPLGHAYRAGIGSRTTNGSGCPYCAGRKVLAGFNDLATLEPGVAAQWHPALNGALTPEMVTLGSHKKVWWQCPDGHVWKAVIYSRAGPKKCGCPVCAGHVKAAKQQRYQALAASHVFPHDESRV